MISEINEVFKIKDAFDAPDHLMEILQDKPERERVFKEMLELFNYKLDFDWFHEYFQKPLANKKEQGQVFTPTHTANLMAQLAPLEKGEIHSDPCAGTGVMTVAQWNLVRQRENYMPSDYRYICEELSGQIIPFLIFNLAIRGMNGVVVHCNVMTRESYGAFLISNKYNTPDDFSIINRVSYDEHSEKILRVKFVTELYPEYSEL